ncbi:TPA: triose-phosphate isomerase [Streptococcus suis]|nr:triose-phosphate isomerase [Streptococcus suis]
MTKIVVKTPFFMFNPKSYLYGTDLLELALVADKIAEQHPEVSVFVTCPFADLYRIASQTRHIIVTAQHIDGINPGRGMGHVLPESVYDAGVRASFINHAERPMRFEEIIKAIERTKELGMISVVCANSVKEAKAIATLEPDIILCEPTELIGTGQTSDASYVVATNQAIKAISPQTLIMQAAGISKPEDVTRVIELGADGSGCTSGITEADNPAEMLKNMILAITKGGA